MTDSVMGDAWRHHTVGAQMRDLLTLRNLLFYILCALIIWPQSGFASALEESPAIQPDGEAQGASKYVASREEIVLAGQILYFDLYGRFEEAELLHQERISNFPHSPDARAEYVRFLIDQGRYREAKECLQTAQGEIVEYVPFEILDWGLTRIMGAQTDDEELDAKLELTSALADYALNRSEALLKSLRKQEEIFQPDFPVLNI